MANYLTTDTDLTAVANAIRTKGGTSAQLTFPQGFVDAIGAISGGGGGGVDLSDLSTDINLNTLGGLFQAFMDGTWGALQLSVVSGTSPIVVNFGRAIKGFVAYPKNTRMLSGLTNSSQTVASIAVFDDPDGNQEQAIKYAAGKYRDNIINNFPFTRINTTTMTNGTLSLVPQYPGNANYHAFGFNVPYTFVYWWEE